MPFGEVDRDPRPGDMEPQWYWWFALGANLDKNMLGNDGLVHNLSKVFSDLDTIDGPGFRYVAHYTSNPRLFYYPGDAHHYDDAGNPVDIFSLPMNVNRKATNVKRPSEVFVVWDGAQAVDVNYNSNPIAEAIDNFGIYYTGLCFGSVGNITVKPSLPILPNKFGSQGVQNGAAAQKQYNVDSTSAYQNGTPPWPTLRFRHVKNSTLAALCLDGHVETRVVGTVTRNDIYTNVP